MFFLPGLGIVSLSVVGKIRYDVDNSEIKFEIVSVPDTCYLYFLMNISIFYSRLTYLNSSEQHNHGHKSNYSTPLSGQEFPSQKIFLK